MKELVYKNEKLRIIEYNNSNFLVSQDLDKILLHTNIRQSIQRNLSESDFVKINRKNDEIIFDILGVKPKTRHLLLITPIGLLKLIMQCYTYFDKDDLIAFMRENKLIDDNYIYIKKREEIVFGDILKSYLLEFGFNVDTQKIIHKYRIDYFVPELNLCIEFDEENHKYKKEYDEEKTQFLINSGYKVLRLNSDINYGTCLANITSYIENLPKLSNRRNMYFEFILSEGIADKSELPSNMSFLNDDI